VLDLGADSGIGGGQMMDAIVPGHDGLVVVIGGDAAVSTRAPSNGSGGSN